MDSAQPLKTTRRQLLAAGAGLCVVACGDQQSKESIQDVSQIDSWPVAKTAQPSTTAELIQQVKSWSGPLCIGGGRYSMGGQIAQAQALHLDLRGMNRLIHLDPAKKIVRAQAGMRWRDLLDLLDPHQLSVEIMQSFANFTLGGSESVNCHGRYVGKGAIVHSIRALSVVLADGRLLEASRTENPSLFAATVGGYAATGVVTEVELDLAEIRRCSVRWNSLPLPSIPRGFSSTCWPMRRC